MTRASPPMSQEATSRNILVTFNKDHAIDWRIAALVLYNDFFFSVSRGPTTNDKGLSLCHRKRLGALC